MLLSVIGEGNVDDFDECAPLNGNIQKDMQSQLELYGFFFANSDGRSNNVPLPLGVVNGEDRQAAEEGARGHDDTNARKWGGDTSYLNAHGRSRGAPLSS